MQSNGKIICLNKIAPVTIFFTAAGIKIMFLNFLPNYTDLLFNCSNIFGLYHHFSFLVIFLFIRFNKIKLGAYNIPLLCFVIIDKNFIEHSLPPVIATIWNISVWRKQFIL